MDLVGIVCGVVASRGYVPSNGPTKIIDHMLARHPLIITSIRIMRREVALLLGYAL